MMVLKSDNHHVHHHKQFTLLLNLQFEWQIIELQTENTNLSIIFSHFTVFTKKNSRSILS